MELKIVPAYSFSKETAQLFKEYTEMLVHKDPSFKEYLDLQNYEKEITDLEVKYGMPEGRLYIAFFNGEPAGCIGLKKIDPFSCEMKRLYVKDAFRKKGIANKLVAKIIEDAKDIGYTSMFLDTLPFLKSALKLYKSYGFYETDSYNNSPMDTSVFMKLDL